MWGIKARDSKEETKVSDLSVWQNGVSTYPDGTNGRRSRFSRRNQEFVWGQAMCGTPTPTPAMDIQRGGEGKAQEEAWQEAPIMWEGKLRD